MKNLKRLNIKELRRMRIDDIRLGSLHDLLKELDKREGDSEDTKRPITSFKRRDSRQDRRRRPAADDKPDWKTRAPRDEKRPGKPFKRKGGRDSRRRPSTDDKLDRLDSRKRPGSGKPYLRSGRSDDQRPNKSFERRGSRPDSRRKSNTKYDKDGTPIFSMDSMKKRKSFRKNPKSKRAKKVLRR